VCAGPSETNIGWIQRRNPTATTLWSRKASATSSIAWHAQWPISSARSCGRPAGVGIGQWAVLMFLWGRDGLSQAELARVVAIEPPTIVRTIDRMVRDGLVTRVPDHDDGRVTRIYLTDRGRSLRDELVPKAVAVNARNASRMTEAEGRTLRRLLGKLLVDQDR
jgi:DNA-binding MarR family transcriptional regulator